MVEDSLIEKTLGLNVRERGAMTVEKALELAEQKTNDASSKLGKTELKLAKTASLFSTRDKELTNYKGGEKSRKQSYYDKGFKHVENVG